MIKFTIRILNIVFRFTSYIQNGSLLNDKTNKLKAEGQLFQEVLSSLKVT